MPANDLRGADRLEQLGRLMGSVDKDLKTEIRKGLRRGTQPAIKAAKRRAATTLPARGGLARKIARSRFSTQVKTGGRQIGIRVTTKTFNPAIDKGTVRHPPFGHRDRKWVQQSVQAGWFTIPMAEAGPAMRKELEDSMTEFARIIEAKAGPR